MDCRQMTSNHALQRTRFARLLIGIIALALTASAQDGRTNAEIGRTASGKVVLHVFRQANSGKHLPVELTTDYGFMVINLGSEEQPKPVYRLGSRTAGTVQDFNTLAAFTAALAKLPKRSVLHRYDKCLTPTSLGIDFDLDEFKATCRKLDIELADNPKLTCNCPE